MSERPPFLELAGVSILIGIIAGSAIGGGIGLGLGTDWIVVCTIAGILVGATLGVVGERRAARRRATSAKEQPPGHSR